MQFNNKIKRGNINMKDLKINPIIFFIISAVMNISAIIFFATGNESSLGTVFLCSGSAFLCIGTAFSRKDSEHKENEKAEDTTETEENTTED